MNNIKPVKIYLGDLTYDTVAVSTEAIPINVGYIASYCKKRFGTNVDIKLFKYIDKLDKSIHDSPPTILGLSNYCWSYNVSLEMFRMLARKNPYSLRVWGGPNFPLDILSQEKFMKNHTEVDVYVPVEGEIGFSNIIERMLEVNSMEELREKVLSKPIDNCIIRGSDGKLQYTFTGSRLKNLDEIPSPYTNNMLDEFFDGKLSPMIQTNRGCPFTCTFCTDGSNTVNQVNKFSPERVREEIFYIAEHVPEIIHNLFISDLNFGMYSTDIETCNAIDEVQKKYGYPEKIQASTGKNKKERIINAIKRLNGTMSLTMSVQSMDEQVLKNIRRSNISVDEMMALAPTIKDHNLRTKAEVILGLPGESYDNHIEGLRKLVAAKMDDIVIHTCMLLNGSEMNTTEERQKWNLKTKFRIIPRDFGILSNRKKICEIEEVVVSSDSLTFDEYLKLRLLAFVLWVTNQGLVYDPIIKFLREQNLDVFELFYRMALQNDVAPKNIRYIFNQFQKSTIEELWNSPEEIQASIQDDKEYQKLLNGEIGINVIQYYHALVLAQYTDEWTEYTLNIAYNLLKEKGNLNEYLEEQFNDITNYCFGLSKNPLDKDRMLTIPEFELQYDITKWLASKTNLSLSSFKLSAPCKVMFLITEKQYKIVQDTLNMYSDNLVGRTKALKSISIHNLWRTPVMNNKDKVNHDYDNFIQKNASFETGPSQ